MSGWKAPLFFLSFSLATVQIARCTPAIEPLSTGRSANDFIRSFQNEGENPLIEKCRKNGGPTGLDDLKAAVKELQTCARGLVDPNEFKNEIEKASPTGSFEPVITSLCKKEQAAKTCVRKFNDVMERCLDQSEKVLVENTEKVFEAFMDFLCFQNGHNVVLFFKEGGMECIESKGEPILNCLNSTLGKYQKYSNDPEKSLFKFGEQECLDIYATQECLVNEMMKCTKPTPGKVTEEMFNFINRRTSCNRVPKKMTETSSIKLTARDNLAAQSGVPSPVGLVLSQSMTPMNATHMQMDLKLLMPRV